MRAYYHTNLEAKFSSYFYNKKYFYLNFSWKKKKKNKPKNCSDLYLEVSWRDLYARKQTPRSLSSEFSIKNTIHRERFIDIWNSIIREANLSSILDSKWNWDRENSRSDFTRGNYHRYINSPVDAMKAKANMNKDKCRWLANYETRS